MRRVVLVAWVSMLGGVSGQESRLPQKADGWRDAIAPGDTAGYLVQETLRDGTERTRREAELVVGQDLDTHLRVDGATRSLGTADGGLATLWRGVLGLPADAPFKPWGGQQEKDVDGTVFRTATYNGGVLIDGQVHSYLVYYSPQVSPAFGGLVRATVTTGGRTTAWTLIGLRKAQSPTALAPVTGQRYVYALDRERETVTEVVDVTASEVRWRLQSFTRGQPDGPPGAVASFSRHGEPFPVEPARVKAGKRKVVQAGGHAWPGLVVEEASGQESRFAVDGERLAFPGLLGSSATGGIVRVQLPGEEDLLRPLRTLAWSEGAVAWRGSLGGRETVWLELRVEEGSLYAIEAGGEALGVAVSLHTVDGVELTTEAGDPRFRGHADLQAWVREQKRAVALPAGDYVVALTNGPVAQQVRCVLRPAGELPVVDARAPVEGSFRALTWRVLDVEEPGLYRVAVDPSRGRRGRLGVRVHRGNGTQVRSGRLGRVEQVVLGAGRHFVRVVATDNPLVSHSYRCTVTREDTPSLGLGRTDRPPEWQRLRLKASAELRIEVYHRSRYRRIEVSLHGTDGLIESWELTGGDWVLCARDLEAGDYYLHLEGAEAVVVGLGE